MAQCQKTAHSFVRDTFSPCIGVICSEEANEICQKNHLSFIELLLPFSRLTSSVHIRDASGVSASLQDFSLQFKDAHVLPPQQTLGIRMLSEAVGSSCAAQRETLIRSGDYEISAAVSTPWFEEYRECFLSIIVPSDHEFLRHYLACIFVVSSAHPDPMNQFAQMTIAQHQQQQQTPAKLPKWFAVDLCRYYILLHDCIDGEDSKAEGVYQSMKSKYGVHSCHLLKINSVSPNPDPSQPAGALPDPWSNFIKPRPTDSSKDPPPVPEVKANGIVDTDTMSHPLGSSPTRERALSIGRRRHRTRSISERGCWLSTHDHDKLKTFVQEFVVRALIPWAERLIKSYNELYQSKKRGGLFKSLFNRGKASESKPVSGGYASESAEMQLRRLADLCFMFQLYDQAYSVYHSLKKDFEGDKIWLYCAGAQEMAGLSIFMQGMAAQRNYPTHYLDGAIDVYQTCKNRSRSQSYMTRAVFISTEVLKVKGLWLQAASQFLKLTGEDFDLRSAVLLEQAAYCYLNMSSPQIRKFAFYMVLAGHRYSKASQRKHSLRCYSAALQVYEGKDWTLAENHIGSTISRLSSQLNISLQALLHSSKLLSESTETAAQQATFLREYLQLYQTVRSKEERSLPEMAVPAVIDNEIMITTDQFDMATNSTVYSDDVRWGELEEACVLKSQGSLPLMLQRSIPSHNKYMKNTQPPKAVLGETQFLRVMVYNPLKITIHISQVILDWRFQPAGEDEYTLTRKDNPEVVQQNAIQQIELSPLQKQWILFRMVPKALGLLNLLSISYSISTKDATGVSSSPVEGRVMLNVRGHRLNKSMQEKNSIVYGQDKRLFINIQPPMPKIKAVFQSFPANMQCGEIVKVPVTLTNIGPVDLRRLHLTCSEPNMVIIPEHTDVEDYSPSSRKVTALDTKNERIKSGESLSFDICLRANDIPATKTINFVFYYESVDQPTETMIRHRCSRYSFVVKTSSELRVHCSTYVRTAQESGELGSYLAAIMLHNCSLPSSEAAIEFAVTNVLCKSKLWQVSALNDDSLTSVKVNQSEVALLSAHLKHTQEEENFQLTQVQPNTDEFDVSAEVVDGFLSAPFVKPEVEPSEDESKTEEVAVVVGILWKGFRMDASGTTTESVGLHCLPIASVKDEAETRTARSPSMNGQYAVLEIPRTNHSRRSIHDGKDDSHGLEYQFLYSQRVTTDMSKTRVCVVPVKLVIKSYSPEEVSVSITNRSVDNGLMWSGKTSTKVTIPPQEESTLELNVTVMSYGVFNLNTLTIASLDKVFIRDQTHLPMLLIVEKG